MKLPLRRQIFNDFEEEKKYFKLEYIPELVKYLCFQGLNYQQILYHYEVVDLLKRYHWPEDFWAYLIKINYETYFYIWAFTGPVNLTQIINKLEKTNSFDWCVSKDYNILGQTDWKGFLTPYEVQKLEKICSYKTHSLDYINDGVSFSGPSPKERMVKFLKQVKVELENLREVSLPFPDFQEVYST